MPSDPLLDAALQQVELPCGYLKRLRRAAEDMVVDDRVCDVAFDRAGRDRLQQCLNEVVVDEPLRDLPVPAGLLSRLRTIPNQRRTTPLARIAAAVLLTICLSASHFTVVSLILLGVGAYQPPEPKLSIIDLGPLAIQSGANAEPRGVILMANIEHQPHEREQVAATMPLLEPTSPAIGRRHQATSSNLHQLTGLALSPGWLEFDMSMDVSAFLHENTLASAPSSDSRRRSARLSVYWPLELGHGRLFSFQDGRRKPIESGQSDYLNLIRVPISRSTTSFDEAIDDADAGRWPDSNRIRSEEFLAAMTGRVHAEQSPAFEVSISRSPFEGQSHYFLLVTTRAVDKPNALPSESDHVNVREAVEIQLEIDPEKIVGYRTVGYGHSESGQILRRSHGDSLAIGQEASVLFEVWLQPDANDDVAWAAARWHYGIESQPIKTQRTESQRTDSQRTESQRLGIRTADDVDFGSISASLQMAILAAETAAILGGDSAYSWQSGDQPLEHDRSSTIDDLLKLANLVDVPPSHRSAFERLVSLLHQLDAME